MTNPTSTCLMLNLSECASVDGRCVHSPHSLAWSPHNVLFVATNWALYLHVNSLNGADAVLRPSYNPRMDYSSQFNISGAKWALHLVPEDAYPAACRLCVRTSRNIFIYRVIRYGSGRIQVSAGVCFSPMFENNNNNNDEEDEEEDGSNVSDKNKRRRKRGRFVPVKKEKNDDSSDDGDGYSNSENNNSNRAKKYDGSGCSIIGYEWFPNDLLVVVTFGGIYLLNLEGNNSDEEIAQQCNFPPPTFKFSGSEIESIIPSCVARILGNNVINESQLIVASPFYLRIFKISTDSVYLTHYVEIPLLYSIPTAICCMISSINENNNNNNNNNNSVLNVYVSAPMCILNGTISLENSNNDNIEIVKPKQVEWNPIESWDSSTELADEISVRRFLCISLGSLVSLGLTNTLDENTDGMDPYYYYSNTSKGKNSPFLVLAQCQRRLFTFVGKRCIELIQCIRINGTTPPLHAAAEISGVSIHPSCTLAILAIRTGDRHYPSFQLFPVPLSSTGGFLSRILQLQKGLSSLTNGEESNTGKLDIVLNELWNLQSSTCCFVWEQLLPGSGVANILAKCYHQQIAKKMKLNQKEIFTPVEKGNVKLLLDQKRDTFGSSLQGIIGKGGSTYATSQNIIRILQQKYIELRNKYGIELFLRFPDNNALWRQTLIRLLRRFPPGEVIITELILGNAIQFMAEEVSYANFTKSGKNTNFFSNIKNNYSPRLQFKAAVEFGKLYQKNCIDNSGIWIYTMEFAEILGKFIENVENVWNLKHEEKEQQQKQDRKISPLFPCSVCGKEDQTVLTLSLSSITENSLQKQTLNDCSDGLHFTIFSGTSFTPLFLVAEDEVVSRCNSCGMYDYAMGALCRICEGLMS